MSKLSLTCVLFVAFAVPTAAQDKRPRGDKSKDLQEAVALAEAQVVIKRAAVKVADAQKRIADAKVRVIKTRIPAAEAMEALAKAQLQRMKRLAANATVSNEEVMEAEARLQSATIAKLEAEGKVLVGEAEVAFEVARRELAEAELADTELRLKQLRERLKPSKSRRR